MQSPGWERTCEPNIVLQAVRVYDDGDDKTYFIMDKAVENKDNIDDENEVNDDDEDKT